MLAAALLIVTCLGFAFPALILREGAATRDARIFAVIGVVDATTSAMRAEVSWLGGRFLKLRTRNTMMRMPMGVKYSELHITPTTL